MVSKKDPKDFTVEEKLKYLYQLQETLSGIDEKRAMRGELPLEVQDLEDEIAGLTTRIEKFESEIAEIQEAVDQKKVEIGTSEDNLARYNAQLDDVKNNREYDMLSKEIEYTKLEVEQAKKKIDEAGAKVNELHSSLADAKNLREERKKDLDQKKAELDEIMADTKEAEGQLKAKAQELETKIEPRLLSSFKRIRRNAHNGLGIVCVTRHACGGCFNKIPPQRELDIKMHKKIIVCEYCGRILIDGDLVGVKDEAVKEEASKAKGKAKRSIKRVAKKAEDKAEEA